MEKGNIVQITNPEHNWYLCLVVVDDIKNFGIRGYITTPTNDNKINLNAYIRLNKEDYKLVGDVLLIVE